MDSLKNGFNKLSKESAYFCNKVGRHNLLQQLFLHFVYIKNYIP